MNNYRYISSSHLSNICNVIRSIEAKSYETLKPLGDGLLGINSLNSVDAYNFYLYEAPSTYSDSWINMYKNGIFETHFYPYPASIVADNASVSYHLLKNDEWSNKIFPFTNQITLEPNKNYALKIDAFYSTFVNGDPGAQLVFTLHGKYHSRDFLYNNISYNLKAGSVLSYIGTPSVNDVTILGFSLRGLHLYNDKYNIAKPPIEAWHNAKFKIDIVEVVDINRNIQGNQIADVINQGFKKSYSVGAYGGVMYPTNNYLRSAYWGNTSFMSPVVGPDVYNVENAFGFCYNLVGNPSMEARWLESGSMYQTYRDCWILEGEPVASPNVQYLSLAYYNCGNLHGNTPDAIGAFDIWQAFENCHSLDGTISDNYISAVNSWRAFFNCTNLHGNAILHNTVVNATSTFEECHNLDGHAYVGNGVTYLYRTFYNCHNLKEAHCGNFVTNMQYAYYGCNGLTSKAAVAENVVDMAWAYQGCENLEAPASNNKVTSMHMSYENCYNMKGTPVLGPAVTAAYHTYYDCHSMTATPDIQGTVPCSYEGTFYNCTNMHGTIYINQLGSTFFKEMAYNCCNLGGIFTAVVDPGPYAGIEHLNNMFNRVDNHTRLNVVFSSRAFFDWTQAQGQLVAGCDFTPTENIYANNNGEQYQVKLPYSYENGVIYGYKTINCNVRTYNLEKNVFVYCIY